MRIFWTEAGLSLKLSFLGVCSVVATAVVIVALAVGQSGYYHDVVKGEVDDLINADLDHITQGVYSLLQTEDDVVQEQLNSSYRAAQFILGKAGGIVLSEARQSWTVVNQSDGKARRLQLPLMAIGGLRLGSGENSAAGSAVVDEIARVTGGVATIFQRMNDAGDMLRVVTTVKEAGGRRAVGTYIPAVGLDGIPSPVISTVLKGMMYYGRAPVLSSWYLTAYGPLLTNTGEFAGVLSVGVKPDSAIIRIRKAIIGTSVGKTGYVYVLGGTGPERGRYIISQRGERDGENVWDSRDSDNRPIIQEIITMAQALEHGRMTTIRYRWQNPGEPEPRWKIARLAYYAPWNWVIGTSAYEDELRAYWDVLSAGRSRMTTFMVLAGLLISLITGLLSALSAWTIVRPVRLMTRTMERVAGGELNHTLEVRHHDEIGALARMFNTMTAKLSRSMEDLRQSEAKYRRIFEDAMEGLFQSTLEGHFLNANPAMARILGYDSAEDLVRGISNIWRELFARPEDSERFLSELSSADRALGREIEFRCRDGQVIWAFINGHVKRDEAGNPQLVDGFLVDVSEKKNEERRRLKLEGDLRQAQKMETVGQLAGGIAHDFNNILQVIGGYCEVLLTPERAGENPGRKEISEIARAAKRAATLTSQLLAFSRKQVLIPKAVNTKDLVRSMEKLLKRVIGEDVELRTFVRPDTGNIRADPGQIEQVLLNLAVNARDAMPSGGKLTIEAENRDFDEAYVREHPEAVVGHYVRIAVSDTGAGMSPEIMSHLFEPFFTTKERGKGTGLGLSMVYGIVKQSEGYINCYSEPGKGTMFTIYLPMTSREPEEAPAAAAEMTASRGKETILVAEDDKAVRKFTRDVLEHEGYVVIEAAGGEEALKKASSRDREVALVVTDVVMPRMGGRELARKLEEMRPGVKVLYVSGYTANAITHHHILDAGLDFLQKPFGSRDLLAKVREILDRR